MIAMRNNIVRTPFRREAERTSTSVLVHRQYNRTSSLRIVVALGAQTTCRPTEGRQIPFFIAVDRVALGVRDALAP